MKSGTQITVRRSVSVRKMMVKDTLSVTMMSVTEMTSAIWMERESTHASPQVSRFSSGWGRC